MMTLLLAFPSSAAESHRQPELMKVYAPWQNLMLVSNGAEN